MMKTTQRRYDDDSADDTPRSNRSARQSKKESTRSLSKGLRFFSQKVCCKVEEKQSTTYQSVATELVGEMGEQAVAGGADGQCVDEKNIKRRVYDAINVLQASGIIRKLPNKDIEWVGLPEA